MNWLGWALLSAFFSGITAILAKVGVRDIDSNLATAIRTVVVLAFSWGVVFSLRIQSPIGVPVRAYAFLVLSGLATGSAWLCYFRALQMGEASKVAPVDKLSVVFAMILASMILGEHLSWRHLIGGAFIVAGVIILARA